MAEMDDLKKELGKLGFVKFEDNTKFRVFVYVPKSDRVQELERIVKELGKFGAQRDTSSAGLKAGGSLGVVSFTKSSFEGLQIAVKPDSSKDLTTDEQESLAAYYIAAKMKNPNTDYSLDDFGTLPVESKFTPTELFMKASKGWVKSSTLIGDRIYKTYGRFNFVICQRSRSSFVKNISDAANNLLKKAGKNIGLDKWNPADIWMVNPRMLSTDFSQFESIHDLNSFLYDKFKEKMIIGVSLKQVSRVAKAEVYNFKSGHKPVVFNNLNLGKTGFTASIDAFVNYNNGSSVVFRSFKPTADISGEIQGRYAQGGKVGFGALREIMAECVTGATITKNTDILREFNKGQNAYVEKLYERAKKIDNRVKSIKKEAFKKAIFDKKAKLEPYIVSKTQALEVVETLTRAKKSDVECAVGKMISYASSSTDVSSVFVKVSNP